MKASVVLFSLALGLSNCAFASASQSNDGTFVDCDAFKLQHIYNSHLTIGKETFLIPEIAAEMKEGGYRGVLFEMTSDSVNYLITEYVVDGASAKVQVSSFGGRGPEATLYFTKNDEIVRSQKCVLTK